MPKLGRERKATVIKDLFRLNRGERTFSASISLQLLKAWRLDRSETGPLGLAIAFPEPSIFGCERWLLRLRCVPIIISENAAKTFPALNAPISAGTVGQFGDQPVVETLVISFQMVMGDVSANGRAKMILAERNNPVETLVLYRTNKTLRVSVQIPTPCR